MNIPKHNYLPRGNRGSVKGAASATVVCSSSALTRALTTKCWVQQVMFT
jgi:hypothetical protein